MFSENISGINNAFSNLEKNAANIARAGYDKDVHLEKEMVGMIENKNNVAINAKAIQIQDETLGSLLDILG